MLADAHCHPYDLAQYLPSAEDERRRLGVICAASATTIEAFEYCEKLSGEAKNANAPALLPCFAVHPQMPAFEKANGQKTTWQDGLVLLDSLADQGRLAAIGETGFDLFDAAFKETEKIQDKLFAAHLATALCHDLPLVIHARRAMHKIFAHAALLKKCRAVIFHSWPGTKGEGEALLRRGINAFFSFGTPIMLNHRQAMHCCATFPASRLLAETDSPFQPLRGQPFSSFADLGHIVQTMAFLRGHPETDETMGKIIEANFRSAFGC
jgi:TatD DNase family protein